jgi:ubiquinone/menaquinone biosynthesis C-methylase UbiE
MSVENAYNQWAESYDHVVNPTRDLDHKALVAMLGDRKFSNILEAGCGTGKNTGWLASRAERLTAVDLSENMLAIAKQKVASENVSFLRHDLHQPWPFPDQHFDLVSFNLVLEHFEDLSFPLAESARVLAPSGWLFICELHPFKQYSGSKARFEKDNETVIVDCYTHHLTDYLHKSRQAFTLVDIAEWFDEGQKEIPRLLSFLFRR